MPATDKRIDAYIDKSAEFAKPILNHLRELIHKGCPDVEETMKWSFPHFQYKGAILCSFASFKQHCVLAFWKGTLLKDPGGWLGERKAQGGEAMGQFGRITNLKELPPGKVIIDFVRQAMKLNEEGVKLPPKEKKPAGELVVPDYFLSALKRNKKAQTAFDKFSTSMKREYVQWITEAKTEETRQKRMDTSIEWISEGKGRNWKYERVK